MFGDSVTYAGYIKNSWANLIKLDLESNSQEDVEFFNLGINGNTSDDILNRFDVEAQARQPELIIFAFGVNDSGYIFDTNKPLVEIQNFETNVKILLIKQKTTRLALFSLDWCLATTAT